MTLEQGTSCALFFRRLRFATAAFIAASLSTGCSNAKSHSPTLDVLGSYFPAWMACIIIGLILTIVSRQILIGLNLNAHLRFTGLVYFCMTILWTLAVWLIWYEN